jgi:Tol biopolymer transport system component
MEPTGEAHALIADPKFNVLNAEISPDGRWIAYDSDESGHSETYVRPFPAVDSGRWQISSEGEAKPLCAPNRLSYRHTEARCGAQGQTGEGH